MTGADGSVAGDLAAQLHHLHRQKSQNKHQSYGRSTAGQRRQERLQAAFSAAAIPPGPYASPRKFAKSTPVVPVVYQYNAPAAAVIPTWQAPYGTQVPLQQYIPVPYNVVPHVHEARQKIRSADTDIETLTFSGDSEVEPFTASPSASHLRKQAPRPVNSYAISEPKQALRPVNSYAIREPKLYRPKGPPPPMSSNTANVNAVNGMMTAEIRLQCPLPPPAQDLAPDQPIRVDSEQPFVYRTRQYSKERTSPRRDHTTFRSSRQANAPVTRGGAYHPHSTGTISPTDTNVTTLSSLPFDIDQQPTSEYIPPTAAEVSSRLKSYSRPTFLSTGGKDLPLRTQLQSRSTQTANAPADAEVPVILPPAGTGPSQSAVPQACPPAMEGLGPIDKTMDFYPLLYSPHIVPVVSRKGPHYGLENEENMDDEYSYQEWRRSYLATKTPLYQPPTIELPPYISACRLAPDGSNVLHAEREPEPRSYVPLWARASFQSNPPNGIPDEGDYRNGRQYFELFQPSGTEQPPVNEDVIQYDSQPSSRQPSVTPRIPSGVQMQSSPIIPMGPITTGELPYPPSSDNPFFRRKESQVSDPPEPPPPFPPPSLPSEPSFSDLPLMRQPPAKRGSVPAAPPLQSSLDAPPRRHIMAQPVREEDLDSVENDMWRRCDEIDHREPETDIKASPVLRDTPDHGLQMLDNSSQPWPGDEDSDVEGPSEPGSQGQAPFPRSSMNGLPHDQRALVPQQQPHASADAAPSDFHWGDSGDDEPSEESSKAEEPIIPAAIPLNRNQAPNDPPNRGRRDDRNPSDFASSNTSLVPAELVEPWQEWDPPQPARRPPPPPARQQPPPVSEQPPAPGMNDQRRSTTASQQRQPNLEQPSGRPSVDTLPDAVPPAAAPPKKRRCRLM